MHWYLCHLFVTVDTKAVLYVMFSRDESYIDAGANSFGIRVRKKIYLCFFSWSVIHISREVLWKRMFTLALTIWITLFRFSWFNVHSLGNKYPPKGDVKSVLPNQPSAFLTIGIHFKIPICDYIKNLCLFSFLVGIHFAHTRIILQNFSEIIILAV